MTGDDLVGIVAIVASLILVVAGLRMAAIWLFAFIAVALVASVIGV